MPPTLTPRFPSYAGYGHPMPSRIPAVTYRTYPTDYPQSRSGYVPLPGYGVLGAPRPAYGFVTALIAGIATTVGGITSLLQGRQARKAAEGQQAADSALAQMAAMQQAAAQQQQMMMAQQAASQQTMMLAGGGLIALLAVGGVVFAVMNRRDRKTNRGRRRNPEAATAAATVKTAIGIASAIAGPIAMAVSYSRNQSLLWAFGAGFVGVPYLVYAALTPAKRAQVARKNRYRRNRSRRS